MKKKQKRKTPNLPSWLAEAPKIPHGWRRVTRGRKQATDKFWPRNTYKTWTSYNNPLEQDLIGGPILSENFVIRKINS